MTKAERFEQLDKLLAEHDGMLQTFQVIASLVATFGETFESSKIRL